MNKPGIKTNNRQHQSGAALVVALILLVALSLMAISSMNTATLDLIMAGNEQYRSRAFAAAETGIERALKGGTFTTAADSNSGGQVSTGDDKYEYTITRPGGGNIEAPPSGYSEGSGQFGTVYFRIASAGTSARDTRSSNAQELYQVVKSGDSATCDTAASCDLGN